ncbi:MAG: transporter permease [Ramlibacter sp.]|nr:transporter permease [Ramlibacter sp.]
MDYTLQFGDVLARWPLLLEGLWRTLLFSAAAIIFGLVIGVFGALGRRARSRAIRYAVTAYVEIIRNTPMLIQLFIIFFVLPTIGIKLSTTEAALVAVVLNNGAYVTEIVRGGIASVHPSQIEAGLSLGLSRTRVFMSVVLLPAIENVYPALVSQFILIALGTSIISAIGADDLTSMANVIQSETFRALEVFIVIGIIYFFLTLLYRALFAGLSILLFPHRRRQGKAVWA